MYTHNNLRFWNLLIVMVTNLFENHFLPYLLIIDKYRCVGSNSYATTLNMIFSVTTSNSLAQYKSKTAV